MSYNKNTISTSKINAILKVLKNLNQSYSLKEIGVVKGYGVNDDCAETDIHKLRRLEYDDNVIIERMVRQTDCDADDVIESIEFKKSEELEDLKLEVTFDNEVGAYL